MHIWQTISFFFRLSHTTAHTKTHTLPQPLPSSLSLVRFSSLPHTHSHTRPSLSGREEGNCSDGKRKKLPRLHQKHRALVMGVFACILLLSFIDRWCCNWGVLSLNSLSMETLRGASKTMMRPDGRGSFWLKFQCCSPTGEQRPRVTDTVGSDAKPVWRERRGKERNKSK